MPAVSKAVQRVPGTRCPDFDNNSNKNNETIMFWQPGTFFFSKKNNSVLTFI